MTTRPTSAQLKKLEVKASKVPVSEIPKASPEVSERAKQILANGSETSTVKSVVLCSDQDRVAFLAHILKGVPFLKKYELFGGMVVVEFTSLAPDTLENIYKFACVEESTNPAAKPDNRRNRVAAYTAATSIKYLNVDNHAITTIRDISWDNDKYYLKFVKTVTPNLLAAIEMAYAKFATLVSTLIEKADDPSFYRAP